MAVIFSFGVVGRDDSEVCLAMDLQLPRKILPSVETPRFDSFVVAVLHHTNLDLLLHALESAHPGFDGHLLVIDNSPGLEAWGDDRVRRLAKVYAPPVPLHFTQSQNLLQAIAYQSHVQFFGFMHSDAELVDSRVVLTALTSKISELESNGVRWAMILTNYDALAVFNPRATQEIGVWDTNFMQYTSDIDYYERMFLGGYRIEATAQDLVLHKVSATKKFNACFSRRLDPIVDYGRSYFTAKWGGPSDGDGGRIAYEFPFQRHFKKGVLQRQTWIILLLSAPTVFVAYRCYRKKVLCRDSLLLGFCFLCLGVVFHPLRQLVYDAGILSK